MDGQAARLHVGLAGECGEDWEEGAREALWEASGLPSLVEKPEVHITPYLSGAEHPFPAPLLVLGLVAPWLLGVLAAHGDAAVRRAVARSPQAPRDLLALLQRAGSTSDLGGPAPPDPALPASDLAWLARGGSWAKRLAARHPNTPPPVLESLARDHGGAISRDLIQNPAPPVRVAPRVAGAQEAARALDESAGGRGLTTRMARAAALANPDVPLNHLAYGATDPYWPCRLAVARNPAASLLALERPEAGDALARLARDGNRLVRAAAWAAIQQRKARP